MRNWRPVVLVLLASLVAVAPPLAQANWLTSILREAGEAGGGVAGRAAKLGLGALDNPALYVSRLPALEGKAALAAHATPDGHWQFANRQGETFTAGTADELARVGQALAPDNAAKLSLYLSEDTVFAQRAALRDLPADADLHIVVGDEAFPIVRKGASADAGLAAQVRFNLAVELFEHALFKETIFQLNRRLEQQRVRVLALQPDGPDALSPAPRFDPATKSAVVDQIAPASLARALPSLRGQTVVVTGRIEGDALAFRPASGSEQTLSLKALTAAAADVDVNLIVLQSSAPRQPGGRNWLWQTVAVSGLDDALTRATFADFLDGIAERSTPLAITARQDRFGRVAISARPDGAASRELTGTVRSWTYEALSNLTGGVIVNGVEASLRDESRQRELDARILPGIPATLQYAYLGALIAGVLGLHVAKLWWVRIWPPEDRSDYPKRHGYTAARVVRLVVFSLVFLPVVGIPALLWAFLLQLWSILTAPLRWFQWWKQRASAKSG